MDHRVQLDALTHERIVFAARMMGCTEGEVVARLVAATSAPTPVEEKTEQTKAAVGVAVFADYEGHRTEGRYDPRTTRIDITSGPLVGQSFKTPTGAAGAVVSYYKPTVSPHRNGWLFWVLDDGSGRVLQKIRK